MGWFPFNYRPVRAWREDLGVELTTTSDEAAKHLDAAVAQLVLMDADPAYGGMDKAMQKAMAADPNFFMIKVLGANFEAQG